MKSKKCHFFPRFRDKKVDFLSNFFCIILDLKKSENFCSRFFELEKIFFSELKKKVGYSFDAEKSDLSVYEVFNTFPALYAAQKTFILFFSLKPNRPLEIRAHLMKCSDPFSRSILGKPNIAPAPLHFCHFWG